MFLHCWNISSLCLKLLHFITTIGLISPTLLPTQRARSISILLTSALVTFVSTVSQVSLHVVLTQSKCRITYRSTQKLVYTLQGTIQMGIYIYLFYFNEYIIYVCVYRQSCQSMYIYIYTYIIYWGCACIISMNIRNK